MIEVKRGNTVVWSGKANGKQYKTVMQEDRVVLNVSHVAPISFAIGDTTEVYGQVYKINRSENISRVNTSVGYSYEIEFEALYYDLGKWMLYTLDKDNQLTEGDVYIMSDARVIVDLIVRNANRASSGWSVGVVEDTEVQQYTYNNSKLLTVLQDLADKNQLEFWVDGRVINLTRRQPNTGLNFEYGKDKGLYQVTRERTDDRVINTLRVLGGSRNLQTGSTGYGFRYLQPTGGNPLIAPYTGDVVEEIVEFGNIYPRLIAEATYIGGAEYNIIRSTDIDFNLNNYLLSSSESAKIVFTTGQLAGFVFTIQSNGYEHSNRQITFNRITNDPAYPAGVPNTALRPAIGDKFVLLDIAMPQSYITTAEAQLKTLGEQYLSDYSTSRYTWRVSPTPKYILENNIEFPLGGTVRLKDTGLDIETDIRIGGYIRDIVEPHLYEITLTNVIKISELVRQANATDRYQNTVSKGLSSDGGNVGKPTLASVTSNGKVTPLDITTYGTYNTGVLGVPTSPSKVEDRRAGMAYVSFEENAPAGVDPSPIGNDTLQDVMDRGKRWTSSNNYDAIELFGNTNTGGNAVRLGGGNSLFAEIAGESAGGGNGQLFLRIFSNGSIISVINLVPNGNVGIGTTVIPSNSKLHVAGNITATGDIIPLSTSDFRLKDNITAIPNALEKLKKIGGYNFEWNSVSEFQGKDVGVIAQDVKVVLPEAVAERDNGFLAVRYDRLIPLLIEGIKELTARVEELEGGKA